MREYEFHPFSERYPLMDGEAFDDLVESIEDGYRTECPIWLYQGKILDGRNRYRACEQSGVVPLYEQFQGDDDDAKRFVVIVNEIRRHFSGDQQQEFRSTRMAAVMSCRAQKKSVRQIAEELNVSRSTVQLDIDDADAILLSQSGTVDTENTATTDTVEGNDGKNRKAKTDKKKELTQLVQRKACQAVKDALRDKEIPLKRAAELAQLPVNQQTAELKDIAAKKAAKKNGGNGKRKPENKDADTPPESDHKDSLGNPIPKNLRDVFAERLLHDASDVIEKTIRDLKAAQRWAVYVRLADAVAGLETAKQAIEDGIPEVVHQACSGKGCQDCRNSGYMPLWRLEELEAAG